MRGSPQHADATVPVLFFTTATRPPLGADSWVNAQVLRHLDVGRHEVHAMCLRRVLGQLTPTFQVIHDIPGLRLRGIDLGRSNHKSRWVRYLMALLTLPKATAQLVASVPYVRRYGVAVLHTTDRPRDAVLAVVLARLTGAKCIIHVHVAYNDDWMGPMLKWSLWRADALIAVSEFVRRSLLAVGHDQARVKVVLNGIDPVAWQPGRGRAAAREELSLQDHTPVISTVCRLFPAKGVATLLEAFRLVLDQVADARLLIVGDDVTPELGHMQDLVGLARELGVAEMVSFTGRRTDIERLLAASDVYAMPSFEEPFGLVFLEAMAMALPVVALDSGGTPEIVEHGRSGYLVGVGDVDSLAEHLVTLIREPSLRQRLGAYGRRQVDARFTVERMARDVGVVYQRLSS